VQLGYSCGLILGLFVKTFESNRAVVSKSTVLRGGGPSSVLKDVTGHGRMKRAFKQFWWSMHYIDIPNSFEDRPASMTVTPTKVKFILIGL
jgi:hypothetical protein